jgi:hypothetical protein
MSEFAQDSFYGVLAAQDGELVVLADDGSGRARSEIQARLPDRLDALLELYLAAYGQDRVRAIEALRADVERLKAVS